MGKRETDRAGKLATEYSNLRRQEKTFGEERKKLYESVVRAMERAGLEKVITEFGSLRLFKRDVREFDVLAAADCLNDQQFKEVTVVRIDPDKLDAKVKLGEIDPRLVEKFVTVRESKELRLY